MRPKVYSLLHRFYCTKIFTNNLFSGLQEKKKKKIEGKSLVNGKMKSEIKIKIKIKIKYL